MPRTKRTVRRARGRPPKNWRAKLLAALEAYPNVTAAVEVAKVSRTVAYQHRREDPEFAAQWDAALNVGLNRLEDEAVRRGLDGWDEPVYQHGDQVGTIRRYSDRLLLALLQAHRPERFTRRQQLEHSGPSGGAIPVTIADMKRMAKDARASTPKLKTAGANGKAKGNGRSRRSRV